MYNGIKRKNFNILVVLLITAILLPFIICLSTISVDAASTEEKQIYPKQKVQLVSVADKNNYSIKSSNRKVIKVLSDGRIKALKTGTAKVTVLDKKTKRSTTYKYNVVRKVKKIKTGIGKKTLFVGCSYKAKLKTTPSKKREKIYWKSSNPKVAIVQNGTVTVKGKGTATISAYTKKKKSSFKINTYMPPAVSIKEGDSLWMKPGEKKTLHQTTSLGKYKASDVTWRSSSPKVIAVDQKGRIQAKRYGTATISVSTRGGITSDRCTVVVGTNEGQLTTQILKRHNINKYNKLVVVAHPDDETLWGGGHMATDDYFIVCITNGDNIKRANEYRSVLKYSHDDGVILNYPDSPGIERDNWEGVKTGLRKDLNLILESRNWEEIITYNPDGVTGHLHHRLTQREVLRLCEQKKLTDRLWYYGDFYNKYNLPKDITSNLTPYQIQFKKNLLKIYKNESKQIEMYWSQMIPYEYWIPAHHWDHRKEWLAEENAAEIMAAEDADDIMTQCEDTLEYAILGIDPSVSGEPAEGYKLESIEVSLPEVQVLGTSEAIDSIGTRIELPVIDISGASEEITITYPVNEILPEGIKCTSPEEIITVKIFFSIPNSDESILNSDELS